MNNRNCHTWSSLQLRDHTENTHYFNIPANLVSLLHCPSQLFQIQSDNEVLPIQTEDGNRGERVLRDLGSVFQGFQRYLEERATEINQGKVSCQGQKFIVVKLDMSATICFFAGCRNLRRSRRTESRRRNR